MTEQRRDDTGGFVQREAALPQNQESDRPFQDFSATLGRAPRATPGVWSKQLVEMYKRARTFDWSHLIYLIKNDLEVAARDGKNTIAFSVDRLPARATMDDLIAQLNVMDCGLLQYSTVTSSLGEVVGLQWK
jgi:hypothetical protein